MCESCGTVADEHGPNELRCLHRRMDQATGSIQKADIARPHSGEHLTGVLLDIRPHSGSHLVRRQARGAEMAENQQKACTDWPRLRAATPPKYSHGTRSCCAAALGHLVKHAHRQQTTVQLRKKLHVKQRDARSTSSVTTWAGDNTEGTSSVATTGL